MGIRNNIYIFFIFLLLSLLNVLLSSCGDEDIKEEPSPVKLTPKINLLTPNNGVAGDTISIIGVNFGNVKDDITVNFGSKIVDIIAFSDKQITFKVPNIDSYGEVELIVKVDNLESNTLLFVLNDRSIKTPKVIDKQLWFVNASYNNSSYRPIPSDPDFYYYSGYPVIPRVQSVPFAWETEKFYRGVGGHITDNVYRESGWAKPWVLQLCISTPGQGDTSTGSPQYKIWYRTSSNNGATFTPLKQAIVKGYTSMNPIKGVEIGRNGYNVDNTRPIVRATNGEIMVPICLHPWDEANKKIYLPIAGAYLFQDVGVLIGKWLPDGSDMIWEFGEWLRIDHNKSTRGLSEPTIVELNKNGHFAMVCRGSNLARLELPCYAWVSFSNDYCRTWSEPEPLTYSTGENFFVTTAHSTLFKSRVNGKTYWIGNLQHENPRASVPRYPLAIGEVDPDNFGVIKETVVEIDTRQPEDGGENLQLSNFSILESDERAEIIVVLTRIEGKNSASRKSWYRIKLD